MEDITPKDFLGDKKRGKCRKCKKEFYTSIIDSLVYFVCPKCDNPEEDEDATKE